MTRHIFFLFFLVAGLACEKKPAEVVAPASGVVEPANSPQSESVAELKVADAKVELRRRDELSWTAATVGVALFNRDAIRTGSESFGRVEFKDRSVLEISERSTVVILDHQRENQTSKSVLELPNGKIRGEVKTDDPVEMVVRTRQGWIKVGNRDSAGKKLETRFSAVVEESGNSEFVVDEGTALYLASGREQTIGVGEKVTVEGQPGEVTAELPTIEPKQIRVETARPETPPESVKPETPPTKSVTEKPKKVHVDETIFEIVSPKDKARVNGNAVTVSGQIGSQLQVFLNGEEVRASALRQFSKKIPLKKGVNLLIFQITNKKTHKTEIKNLEIFSD